MIPKNICVYPVVVGRGDEVNTYADGQKVVIAKGLMRFRIQGAKDSSEMKISYQAGTQGGSKKSF